MSEREQLERGVAALGALAPAPTHLQHMIAFYEPLQHHGLAFTFAVDPGV